MYNEELLVKTISSRKGLTIEQQTVIDATVQRNPAMNRMAEDNPEGRVQSLGELRCAACIGFSLCVSSVECERV